MVNYPRNCRRQYNVQQQFNKEVDSNKRKDNGQNGSTGIIFKSAKERQEPEQHSRYKNASIDNGANNARSDGGNGFVNI